MKNPLRIILLILTGEATFLLPFVLARVFRPTFLSVFQLNNTQLGSCYSVYGFMALASYLFGGTLADRIAPGKLMATALLLTAEGGFFMTTIPNVNALRWLYAYWGFTTVFLFWSAMIKATRAWEGCQCSRKGFWLFRRRSGFYCS